MTALRLLLLVGTLCAAAPVGAQVSCSVQHPGAKQTRTCTVTLSTTLQLTENAQLTLSRSTTDLADATITAADQLFLAANDTGVVVMGPSLHVSANRAIAVTLVNAPQFTGPALKPASEVSLGVSPSLNLCAGVPMIPLSDSPTAIQQAMPRIVMQTAGAASDLVRQLCFRVHWRYATDPPGSYSLPLTFSITAP